MAIGNVRLRRVHKFLVCGMLAALGLVSALLCGCSNDATRAQAQAIGGTDAGSIINAQIRSLPTQGGVVDVRSMTGAQRIDSTITIDRPVTLLLGAATFTCGAALVGSCIQVTSPAHIHLLPASTPTVPGAPAPDLGTKITAQTGFSGFLISVEGSENWNSAFGTIIEGGVLDGNGHSASGVNVRNQFGVQLRNINIINADFGVRLENTDRLFTEGSWLDTVWIFDPKSAGVDMRVGPAGTASVANAYWNRLYINLYTDGAVAIQSDAAANFANSLVGYTKIWMSSGNEGTACQGAAPVRLTGIRVRSNWARTVFENVNVEALSCAGSNLVAVQVDPGATAPVFDHLTVTGFPLPTVQ